MQKYKKIIEKIKFLSNKITDIQGSKCIVYSKSLIIGWGFIEDNHLTFYG